MRKAPSSSGGNAAGLARRVTPRRVAFAVFVAMLTAALAGVVFVAAQAPAIPVVATVRHAPVLNGRVEGSVQMLTGEYLTLNGGAVVKGDLLVPGTPTVVRNGSPIYQGAVDGGGSASPSNYQVTLNSGSEVRYVRRRADPVSLAPAPVPPAPAGTRYVTVNSPGQSVGTWATVRNLTLNSNVGPYAVPAGTYGAFTANGGGSFVLGTAGATQASVYNFEDVTLNSLSNLNVVGPVVVNVANRVSVNSSCVVGSAANPRWLALNVSRYDVTINGGQVYGVVRAPSGSVTLSAATLKGEVACDRLALNGGTIIAVASDTTPPTLAVSQPANGALVNTASVNVTGTFADESATTVSVNGVAATVSGNSFSATAPLTEGANTLTVTATDSAGNSSNAARTVTRDTTKPAVTVAQPVDGQVTSGAQATVSGTVSDATTVSVTVNGVATPVTAGSFSATVPVVEGPNPVTVVAVDAAGNQTAVARGVVRDSTPPAITFAQPDDGMVTAAGQVSVSGTVADATATTVNVNGTAAAVSQGQFSATVPLPIEGINTLRVVATDAAGNNSELSRDVTRDTTAPVLNLDAPADHLVTGAVVTVTGTVIDSTPVTVTANGNPVEVLTGGVIETELTLPEGTHSVMFTATDSLGNHSEVTRSVTVDLTPPVISDLKPDEGTKVDGSTTVTGRVADVTAVSVYVNGAEATVANGVFTATGVIIPEGQIDVMITALDAAGNSGSAVLTLNGKDKTPPPSPTLSPIISPTRLSAQVIGGRAEPGAQVVVSGGVETITVGAAFGSGAFTANVKLAAGVNNLSVTASDADGNTSPAIQLSITSDPNLAPPPAGSPAQINISTGNAQKGLVNTELPRPLIAIVTDRDGAPVADVPVRFAVEQGGGQFTSGGAAAEVRTDAQGRASVRYVSGVEPGPQQVRADFSGNLLTPATFLAETLQAPPNGETTVSGVVYDQNLRALPNVVARIGGQQVRTGADGRFLLRNVASGPHQLLELIGRDQITLPGRWPNISYDLDVLPGVSNELRRPLFLPKVNGGVEMPLDADNVITKDTTYELPAVGGEPPVRVTAKAGTHVQFPPDVTDKRLSVTRIASNRVPMTLEDGRATNLYVSVQPSGALFSPPLEVSFPNLDRLPAGDETLLMSFDHDAGRYVKVGAGHVSADGKTVTSDPGSGIRVGAWHSFPPDPPKPQVTVLGHIQVAGNPAFKGKEIDTVEAWVDGTPAVLLSPLDSPIIDVSATFTLPDNAPLLTNVESSVVTSNEVKVKLSADQSIKDGENATISVTVDNAQPTAYEWKYEIPSGVGNAPPSQADFFNPNGQPSVTVKGHWYAYPDQACSNVLNPLESSINAVYTIKCKVTYTENNKVKTKTAEGKLTVSGLVGKIEYDAQNKPTNHIGGTTPVAKITGGAKYKFDSAQNKWVWDNKGSLARALPTANVYVSPNSQFYNKVSQHEKKHEDQWKPGGIFSPFFDLQDWINVASKLTSATPVTDGGAGIQAAYIAALRQWLTDQNKLYCGKYNDAEKEAYAVSDPIAPKYIFQRCDRSFSCKK